MSTIHFEAKLSEIGAWTILRLPKSASLKLPSRGMVMIEGTINDLAFKAPLEPDGKGSHWFRVDESLLKTIKAEAGDKMTLVIKPAQQWSEPRVPGDLKQALAAAPQADARWINSTKQPETRKRWIEVAISKLKQGARRPCCFNRTMCTDPSVSRNGVLLEPNAENFIYN